MSENQKVIIDIPVKTILKVVATLLFAALLFHIRDVIILFFVVLILFAALNPIVNKWEEEMSRKTAIIFLFTIIVLFAIAAGLLIIPPLVTQLQEFARHIPDLLNRFSSIFGENIISESQKSIFSLSGTISKFGTTVFNTTVGFIGGLVAVLTVLVSCYYLLSERDKISKFVSNFPVEHKGMYLKMIEQISAKMGAWLRGQLSLMLIVGALNTVILAALGVPYTLALGVWAGLTEVIPYLGPILGAIPAVLAAFFLAPWKGVVILIWFILVQQFEGQFLVPRIMGKAVGLSPVIIIFAMLAGGRLLGVLGIFLAVPAAATLSVFVQEYLELKIKE